MTEGSYCKGCDPHNTYRDPEYRVYKRLANQRDRFACVICGSRKKLGTHHITRHQDGGGHTLGNLVTLCRPHHNEAENGTISATTLRELIGRA